MITRTTPQRIVAYAIKQKTLQAFDLEGCRKMEQAKRLELSIRYCHWD